MKHFFALSLILLTGCQSMPHITAHLKPMASMTTTPRVEFMGDSQIAAVVAFADNPLWKCTTCVQGQLSSQVLAEVPEVIALHPDIVVVQTGAYDLYEGVDDTAPGRDVGLFGNVTSIMDAFEAAKITVVICKVPDSTVYDDYYFDEGLELEGEAGIIPDLISFTEFSGPLTDGIDYSQAGLEELYPAFYQEVESFGLGGQK